MTTDVDIKKLTWEYECKQCQATFEVDVPHGPKEESEITCPECESKDIERVNVCCLQIAFTGG